jgi:hypothetical protein
VIVAIVAVETFVLLLLVVLVAGLLRSHAELLRRLGPPEASGAPSTAGAGDGALRRGRPRGTPAPAIAGVTPAGDALSLAFSTGAPTLLAFLTSGCTTCAGFWDALGERRLLDVQTVIVTHGAERELPAKLASLAPDGIPVVMSEDAWEHYAVPGAPYFVLVDGTIRGEGTSSTWQGLASLVGDAIAEQQAVSAIRVPDPRTPSLDQTFMSAGIGPDHPSLRPSQSRSS